MERISPQALVRDDVALFAGKPANDTAAAATATDRDPPLRRLLQIAARRRWVLAGALAAGALVGVGAAVVSPRQYAANARLQISRETSRVVKIDSVERETSMWDQEFYQTQYGLLRSQTLAERVARDLGVVDDPAFFNRFGRKDAFKGDRGAPTPENRAKRNEIAGRILLDHVGVSPVRGSSLVDVRAVTPDPDLSRRIAQLWCQDFIASNLERRFEASAYASHFLEGRLEQLRDKLQASERQAVTYAAQQGIVTLPSSSDKTDGGAAGGRSLLTDDLATLNAALEMATAERIQAQSRLNEARRPDASNLALTNEAINVLRQKRADAASEYAKLMVQFQPDYPQAKSLESQVRAFDQSIAQEESRIRTSLEQSFQSGLAREQALAAKVEGLKRELTDLRQRDIQYNIYQRDADTNRELYNALLQRYKEIGVAGGVDNNNIAIIDSAKRPERPSSPRLMVDVLLGLIMGGLAGAGLAGALEQIDDGVNDPSELERKLGVPSLGVAPRVKSGDPLTDLRDPRSRLVEAYLAVQANLELSTARGMPRSLAVVSTRPREGKSTTTIALAQALARAHRKVALIDADLRMPSLHAAFRIRNTRGVTNFLAGDDDLAGSLHATQHAGLHIMPAGPQPPNAAELLIGDRLHRLIERLQKDFDHVIVDCPPVLGLADAPLVAAAVEGVVYAVEARQVPARAAGAALGRLRTARAHVLGAVLTKFEARRSPLDQGYEYDYGYG